MDAALFRAGSALIALHVVFDAFLFPQPGTGVHDNVTPGLAPLAVLALANVAYPRLRTGARAALLAALGALAAEGAALAFADATATFGRPSDWTGFLLAPTALAFLGVAVSLVWRSRKPGALRHLRRVGLGAATVVGFYYLVVPTAMALYAAHRPRAAVPTAVLGAPFSTVTIRRADGLRLAAWYVPSRNGAAIISFPTRHGKLAHARMLIRHGYGVLLLDMHGYEGSEGIPNAFGWGATKDIDAAVAWLGRRPDVRGGRIGGIGFSVGGEQMLEAAAGNPGLRAVVSEGAGERSLREASLRGWRAAVALPESAAQTAAVAIFSQSAPPPSLRDVAERISPGAVLFVYGGRGGGGEELTPIFYRAARRPKAVWRIPEAGHVGGLAARPREYEQRVVGFFDRHLGV